MKICQSCKTENGDGFTFCIRCGYDIRSTLIDLKEAETSKSKREKLVNGGVMKTHGTAAFIATLIAVIISGIGTVFGFLLAFEGSTDKASWGNVGAWAFSFVLFLSLNGLIQLVKNVEVNTRGKQ